MELRIEDLIEKCPTCEGSGQTKVATEPASGQGGYGRHVQNVYPLSSNCPACNGTGYLELTPLGKVFKQFFDVLQRGRTRS